MQRPAARVLDNIQHWSVAHDAREFQTGCVWLYVLFKYCPAYFLHALIYFVDVSVSAFTVDLCMLMLLTEKYNKWFKTANLLQDFWLQLFSIQYSVKNFGSFIVKL